MCVVGHSSLSCKVVELISSVLQLSLFLTLVNHMDHKLNRNTLIINAELHATSECMNECEPKRLLNRRDSVRWPAGLAEAYGIIGFADTPDILHLEL